MEATRVQNTEISTTIIHEFMRQANRDAADVAEFLGGLGFKPVTNESDDCRPRTRPEVYLGLAAAIRFRRWELDGFNYHTDAGLPTAHEVFEHASSSRDGRKLTKYVNDLHARSFQIHFQRFLWSAHDCDLQAEIAIDAKHGEVFLDAIADFLLSVSS